MTAVATIDLAEFLLARIAEDEQRAERSYGEPPWHSRGWSPQRVLAECDAKRRIVEMRQRNHTVITAGLQEAMAFLALPYADHPDYREEFRP